MNGSKLKVLVAGCGNMGASHARAYHNLKDFEIAGLIARGPERSKPLADELGGVPVFFDFEKALQSVKPDVVSINTYPDTHARYAKMSLQAGCHVFVEKPLATTVKEAEEIVQLAREKNKKLVIGYILRVHPSWKKFVEIARELGKPLVMRMNLNQQSSGKTWLTHKSLMESMSPIVDCGVHYVDIMCLMTNARPVQVNAVGARLTEEIDEKMYNYGHLQVVFEDGSVGWYEAGWGPMISETAFFVKDVFGPKGSISIVNKEATDSDDIDQHSKTNSLKFHRSDLDEKGKLIHNDEWITTADEPGHQELCQLEQEFLLKAIKEDIDLYNHQEDAVNSLKIVLAADESVKTGKAIYLKT